MISADRKKLEDRVTRVAESVLAARKFVRPIDVFTGIGWLDPDAEKRWRQGQIHYLERVVNANLKTISLAMKLFRAWARARRLVASEAKYVSHTPARRTLRFSISGTPAIELAYRTHWISPELSEQKRARLAEKASRISEPDAVQPRESGAG